MAEKSVYFIYPRIGDYLETKLSFFDEGDDECGLGKLIHVGKAFGRDLYVREFNLNAIILMGDARVYGHRDEL